MAKLYRAPGAHSTQNHLWLAVGILMWPEFYCRSTVCAKWFLRFMLHLVENKKRTKSDFMSKLWFLFLLHSVAAVQATNVTTKHSFRIASIRNIFKSPQHLYSGDKMDSAMITLLVYFRCHHILIVWLINNILMVGNKFHRLQGTDRYGWGVSCHSI